MKTCSVEGCERSLTSSLFCAMHYARVRQNGNPGPSGPVRKAPEPKIKLLCSLCGEQRFSRGYCEVHYMKDKNLRKRFGITLQKYLEIWAFQDCKCKICGRTEGIFHVDHCHELGHVRGILCHHCNTALGNFGDSIETMEKAIDYLKEGNYAR